MSVKAYIFRDCNSPSKRKNPKMQAPKNTSWLPKEASKSPFTSTSTFGLSAEDKLLIMESLDHIYVLRQYQQMGSCSVCKKISIKKCPGCGIFYCSDECQTFDWPKHQAVCPDQRDSMSERNSLASSRRRRGGSFVKQFNGEVLMMTDRISPFTSLANQLSKKPGSLYSKSKSLSNLKMANRQNQNQTQNQSKDRISKVPDVVNNTTKETKKGVSYDRNNDRRKSFSPKKMSGVKKPVTEEKAEAFINKNDLKTAVAECNDKPKPAENVLNEIKDKLKQKTARKNWVKPEPVEVIGTYREGPDRYWVMAVRNLQKYEEIQDTLNKYCADYDPIIPTVGLVCGCTFSEEWYRAEILTLAPQTIVHFIDYGNSTNYEFNIFKKLPNHIRSTPGLAFLIQFGEGTPEEYKTKDLDSLRLVVIESSKAPDGTPIVSVIEGLYGATTKVEDTRPPENKKVEKSRLGRERSVMDTITTYSSGMMFFVPGEGTIRFASIIPDNHKDANDCIEKVLSIDNPNSCPIDAKEGEYVLVTDKEGNDQRGKIVSKLGSTYFVQLIDCGNVISTEHVYGLPENLRDLIELGVKVTVEEVISPELMKRLETCFFTINGEAKCKRWPCLLKVSEQKVIAKVLIEKPIKAIHWQPQYAFLKSGSTVEISSLCPPNFLYVRSVDVETEQKFLQMNMEMIQFAPEAQNLPNPPLPGELCCARFLEDNCFYRAVVSSVEKGKIWVLFVDFGNEQETDLKDIKPIPDSLKNIPFFAVKVKLRNVSSKPWNNMIIEYIEKLTTENIELTLIARLHAHKTYRHSLSKLFLTSSFEGFTVRQEQVIFRSCRIWYGSTCYPTVKAYSELPNLYEVSHYFGGTLPDSISNGVVLREKVSGVVVNDFIEKTQAKSKFSANCEPALSQKEEIYLDDDLKYTTVPPNSVCDLAVLYISESEYESNYTFWAAVSEAENFGFVNGDLSVLISDYCTRTSTPYKPSFRELCLAEFEGSWYRAICIGSEGDFHKVFFVDFGNFCELKADSIRKMTKEFITAPALAMNCTIDGREKLKANPELAKKIFEMLSERLNTVLNNVKITQFEEDTFFLKIPDIEPFLRV